MKLEQGKTIVVTAEQMQAIEEAVFAQKMPVPSLMEKAALLLSQKIIKSYPLTKYKRVGIIVGCGHNGGDALVVARELFLQGYEVCLWVPLAEKSKPLTRQHLHYAQFLGMSCIDEIKQLENCQLIIDGLFGFGLQRDISGQLAETLSILNQWSKPVVSIDVPSGIHTDTGSVLGIAIRASETLCLGLWKLGLFQSSAIAYTGKLTLIDIGIPDTVITKAIDCTQTTELMTAQKFRAMLPLPRAVDTHKYKQGNVLLICGSQQYPGAAILAGYGANSAGVGMLTMLVPNSVKTLIHHHLPSAVAIASEETSTGAINSFPEQVDLGKYDVIAFGMGISREFSASIEQILRTEKIVVIDADGLNLLAQGDYWQLLGQRQTPVILTPHEGEFKRLFPDLDVQYNRLQALQEAARRVNGIVLLKGAKTMISDADGHSWIVTEGTPALARGGSGDVLSGLITAFVAQADLSQYSLGEVVAGAAWLHQQAAILGEQDLTQMGIDGVTLSQYITKAIALISNS